MSNNAKKWIAVLGLAATCGILETLMDVNAGWREYLRHALTAMLPAAYGLRTTLERSLGIEEQPEKSQAAGAGD